MSFDAWIVGFGLARSIIDLKLLSSSGAYGVWGRGDRVRPVPAVPLLLAAAASAERHQRVGYRVEAAAHGSSH